MDQDTLLIEHFYYDGGGASVYFYLGAQNTTQAFSTGLRIGPQLLGSVFNDASFLLDLPAGTTLDAYNAVSVWCVLAGFSFGNGHFVAVPPATYCSAKQNSQGCTPQVGYSGSPSATSTGAFTIVATQMINSKAGLLLYGHNGANLPFSGSVLCIGAPLRRTGVQNSGGNMAVADCSGSYGFDFRAEIQSGSNPMLLPGTSV